ncbi:hypothetical protein [Salipiger sp. PrR002]|uniref:hypothetical protein n=1 Tax=Salipiger sp. PrR002 TaxID=2706489 RepID=UPI0013BBD434|nr:hypothetical protein [Salipiger sp. PrR002]NDV99594.1 hypothetical protein [Salipiger sp. PrR002]NDW57240.1 hypothetical protein [Salipiger sp. PrR004]
MLHLRKPDRSLPRPAGRRPPWIARVAGLALAAFGLAVAGMLASCSDVVEIRIDPSERFQTMRGWEATADLPDDPTDWPLEPYRMDILDRAVNQVGIDRVRLEIRAGAENPTNRIAEHMAGKTTYKAWKPTQYDAQNDNDDPHVINWDGFDFSELDWHVETYVLPMQELLSQRSERLFVNLCYVSFRDADFFQAEPEEYAELVEATYRHLRDKYGLVPDSWEVILEPDLPRGGWTGTQIGEAMVASARRLQAMGIEPAFVVPSVTNMANAVPYLDEIGAVPGALEHVVEVSYHRYKGRSPRTLGRIATRAAELGIETSMLEWWFGKGTQQVLLEDLTVGNAASWQGRVINGLFDFPAADLGDFSMQPEVRYTSQYFRHIRQGAVRIGAETSQGRDFSPVAFMGPDERVTVLVNAEVGGELSVRGLPPGDYRTSYTTQDEHKESEDLVKVDDDGTLLAAIPNAGVLVIHAVR